MVMPNFYNYDQYVQISVALQIYQCLLLSVFLLINYFSRCVMVLHIIVFAFSLSLTRLMVNTFSYVYHSFCYLLWSVYLSFSSPPALSFILLTCRSLCGYDSFVGYMCNIHFLPLWGMLLLMISFQYFLNLIYGYYG